MDPWGTPHLTFLHLEKLLWQEFLLVIHTLWCLHAIMLAAMASSCHHSVSSFFCCGCASAGRTGHFWGTSVMLSRQWAHRRLKICHFHLGKSSEPSSFSFCALKSLVLDMLRLILSLHVTGTITITFIISQQCFWPKSHVPGPINCCRWGRKLFCNAIWWKAAQTSTKEEYRNHSSVHSTLGSKCTRT